jgi:tripartite-type tricarboxylate transporter receptor subunit TctC
VDFLYVPYKGNGPAMSDLLAGQLDFMFNTLQLVAPLAKAGRLRALAVTSDKRSELMPGYPPSAKPRSRVLPRKAGMASSRPPARRAP